MKIDLKRALPIALIVAALFTTVELYGLAGLGDWELAVVPTIAFELLAITLIVAPMVYGVMFNSEHDPA